MRSTKQIAFALIGGLISVSAFAEGSVATVNGVAIPQSKLDAVVKQYVERGQKDTPELRDHIKQSLITAEVVYQEAVKKGADKTPEVQSQVEAAKQQIVAQSYVGNWVKNNPVSAADEQKEYDKYKAAQGTGKEYHVRHILVKTEPEAKAIIADLKKGKKFDDIAKAKSIDTGSGAQGGDLGWANATTFVPEFTDAMKKLEKGKMTETPVKTQYGYHIIKLDDTRPITVPSLDEMKADIDRKIQSDRVQKMIDDLRAKATVQ